VTIDDEEDALMLSLWLRRHLLHHRGINEDTVKSTFPVEEKDKSLIGTHLLLNVE
jgi:hypothetical protein